MLRINVLLVVLQQTALNAILMERLNVINVLVVIGLD